MRMDGRCIRSMPDSPATGRGMAGGGGSREFGPASPTGSQTTPCGRVPALAAAAVVVSLVPAGCPLAQVSPRPPGASKHRTEADLASQQSAGDGRQDRHVPGRGRLRPVGGESRRCGVAQRAPECPAQSRRGLYDHELLLRRPLRDLGAGLFDRAGVRGVPVLPAVARPPAVCAAGEGTAAGGGRDSWPHHRRGGRPRRVVPGDDPGSA
jgi:hypothetical protein